MTKFMRKYAVSIAAAVLFATASVAGSLNNGTGLPLSGGTLTGDLTMGSGTQILADRGSKTAPGFAWSDDTDTGWFSNFAGRMYLSINDDSKWIFLSNQFKADLTDGPSILREAATATNPTLNPSESDIDTGIAWAGANQLSLTAGAVEGIRVTTTETQFSGGNTNDAFVNIGSATASAAFDADGSTHTFSNLIPAGCFLKGLGTRITETIVGATTVQVGDGSDVDLWGVSADVSVNTTTDYTDYTAAGAVGTLYIAANDVVITAVGGAADFSDGTMRVVAHCETNTAPTG